MEEKKHNWSHVPLTQEQWVSRAMTKYYALALESIGKHGRTLEEERREDSSVLLWVKLLMPP